jgi:hypothetical protein
MRSLVRLRFLAPLLLGVGLGVFLADANCWHKDNGVLWWILRVPLLYAILYYPAGMLFRSCVFLHIGPSGNAAWNMYPYCVVAQWATFGLLIGLWLLRRQARATHRAQHPATSLDVASVAKGVTQVRRDYVAALHCRPHPTSHPTGLIAQARRVLAHLPYFCRKPPQSLPPEDHDERAHLP